THLFSAGKQFITALFSYGFRFPGYKTVVNTCMAVYKNAVHRDQLFIPDKQTVSLFNIIYLNTLFFPVQNTGNPYRKIAFIVPFKRKEIVCFLLKEFPQQEKENES